MKVMSDGLLDGSYCARNGGARVSTAPQEKRYAVGLPKGTSAAEQKVEGCLWARTWILGMPGKNSPLEKARAWVAAGTERAERRAERASILAFWGAKRRRQTAL